MYITKDIALNKDEKIIYKNNEPVFIINYKTLQTRQITKNVISQTLVDDRLIKEIEQNCGDDLLDLAHTLVDVGECKNMGEAITRVCNKYPTMYSVHSNNVINNK